MATAGNAAKVGAAVLVALVLFGGMWAFFLQQSLLSRTYPLDVLFDDATGIDKGAPIQQAGVQVGTVDAVRLVGQKADLLLKINEKVNGQPYHILRGSHFVISTPLLGSSGVLTILPPTGGNVQTGDVIHTGATDLRGERTGDLTASLSSANALIAQLTLTAKSANSLLSDKRLQNNLLETVNNIDEASRGGARLTNKLSRVLDQDNAQVLSLLHQTRASSQVTLDNINATTGTFRSLASGNRAQLSEIVSNLRDTTSSVAGLTQQANELLSGGSINKNLSATVANLKATTDKLSLVATNIQSLTGDAAVQANLKGTVQNIHDASEQTELLLERLNKIAGTKKKTAAVIASPIGAVILPGASPGTNINNVGGPHSNKIFIPLIAPRADFLYDTRDKHARLDLDAVVPVGGKIPGLFGRVGIFGLGDSEDAGRLILEGGRAFGPDGLLTARAGLYASTLAIGGDIGLGRRNTLSLEAYDINRYHLDARGTFTFMPGLGLVLGAENMTRRAAPLIGLEYRRSGK